MKKRLLDEALAIARRTSLKHPERRHYMHWTFIVADGKIIEWATNKVGEPPVHFGYHWRRVAPKLHAEYIAFKRARGLLDGPFDVINVRLNRRGAMRMSAPCEVCGVWLKAVGCRNMWFTTDMGWASL